LPHKSANALRQPKLRKKKVGKHTYWYTEANGGAYFGKVGEVPYKDAKHHFGDHIKQKQAPLESELLIVGRLFSSFLTWIKENRSDAQYQRRKRDCSRFARFVFQGQRLADIPAIEVTGAMLEAWRANMRSEKEEGVEGENAPTPRHINLNDTAVDILGRLCKGRDPEEFIFQRPWRKPWSKKTLNTRLHSIQRIAVALGTKVRANISIYDFRHLWISEALMAGVDVMTVAKMAGTSVRMIETVYGHFRTDHFAEAQRRLEEQRKARLAQTKQAEV
jgi:integrase